ncbi:unnamed protein product [Closterium sp. Naga37s-1]|nr:unnamed protein product [Closterium sp. Naga37s-1]
MRDSALEPRHTPAPTVAGGEAFNIESASAGPWASSRAPASGGTAAGMSAALAASAMDSQLNHMGGMGMAAYPYLLYSRGLATSAAAGGSAAGALPFGLLGESSAAAGGLPSSIPSIDAFLAGNHAAAAAAAAAGVSASSDVSASRDLSASAHPAADLSSVGGSRFNFAAFPPASGADGAPQAASAALLNFSGLFGQSAPAPAARGAPSGSTAPSDARHGQGHLAVLPLAGCDGSARSGMGSGSGAIGANDAASGMLSSWLQQHSGLAALELAPASTMEQSAAPRSAQQPDQHLPPSHSAFPFARTASAPSPSHALLPPSAPPSASVPGGIDFSSQLGAIMRAGLAPSHAPPHSASAPLSSPSRGASKPPAGESAAAAQQKRAAEEREMQLLPRSKRMAPPGGAGGPFRDSEGGGKAHRTGLGGISAVAGPGALNLGRMAAGLGEDVARAAATGRLLASEDGVLCKIRAKRGCATHPRSIAERVRRSRIADNMKRLAELVPNTDKQANTADMLDDAIDYMRHLQTQLQAVAAQHPDVAIERFVSRGAAACHPLMLQYPPLLSPLLSPPWRPQVVAAQHPDVAIERFVSRFERQRGAEDGEARDDRSDGGEDGGSRRDDGGGEMERGESDGSRGSGREGGYGEGERGDVMGERGDVMGEMDQLAFSLQADKALVGGAGSSGGGSRQDEHSGLQQQQQQLTSPRGFHL